MKIAVVHDDEKFCAQLEKLLGTQSHAVECAKLGDGLVVRLGKQLPLLVVVAAATQAQAVRFVQDLRAHAQARGVPILCVNPQGRSVEGVALLDAGADDFINRPFNGQIFLARVRTLLRRRVWSGALREEESAPTLENGSIHLQLVSRQASIADRGVELTRLEFDLLAFLLRSPDRAFTRQELLEGVWNYPQDVETRTLDKHIETLRRKLGAVGSRIVTVHGHGYRLAPEASSARSSR